MARKPRITVPGVVHHIIARGIEGRRLFIDDNDRTCFCRLLESVIKKSGYKCYAWVLMDTHYHLLFRTSEYPLSKVMRWLNSCYAQHYNDRYDRSGYLFQGRYKSIASQDQKYLKELVRYIHLNPIRGGKCRSLKQLDRYDWSGHAVLMGNSSNAFQDTEDVLRRFDKWHKRAQVRYRLFIRQGMGARRMKNTLEHLRKGTA